MKRTPISVLLPTYNCAASIRRTLDSVCWADEIVVVDSFSTDETLAICQQYGARIVQHVYVNSAKQKNWAIPHCSHEWVLQIDADETLEAGLREELLAAVAAAPAQVHAFRIPRKNEVLGRWMRYAGVYPDYQIRLFRRDLAHFGDREVHEYIRVAGSIGTLRCHLLHEGMPAISKQLANLDRYTRYEANELRKRGARFHWHALLLRPWLVFLHRYLWLQGFREGWRGLIVCAYFAMYECMSRAKLWELEELGLERSP